MDAIRTTRWISSLVRSWALFAAVVCMLAVGACSEQAEPHTAVGVLIPRTGALAYLGDNVEGAIVMATREVNDAGGLLSRPMRLRLVDTHSDPERGLARLKELIDSDVLALIGPKNEDLAKRAVALLKLHGIAQISGGVTSPTLSTADDNDFSFRTCPSSRTYGKALAQRMFQDGVRTVAVLHVSDEYGVGFANVVTSEFSNLGGQVVGAAVGGPIGFEAGQTSYRELVAGALSEVPDALVLIADDVSGSAIVGDAVILGAHTRWYLSPTLASQAFLQRIPSGFLEGAVGVGPFVERDLDFERVYREQWFDQQPHADAYYFYDATIVTALAVEAAGYDAGGEEPTRVQVRDALRRLTAPPGTDVYWNALDDALARVRDGEDVTYHGVTGPIELDQFGDRIGQRVGFWTITNHTIKEPSAPAAGLNMSADQP